MPVQSPKRPQPPKRPTVGGQQLLFRCLETGFITTGPALTRYQQGRGIDPTRRERLGERPKHWEPTTPTSVCEHCGLMVRGTQWDLRQHQRTRRCQKASTQAGLNQAPNA
jgi:hypothetical protein